MKSFAENLFRFNIITYLEGRQNRLAQPEKPKAFFFYFALLNDIKVDNFGKILA